MVSVGRGVQRSAGPPTRKHRHLRRSIVRLADSVPSGSAEEPRTDICATQGLDATFMENRNSNAQSANNLKYQYFGSVNGMHRECSHAHGCVCPDAVADLLRCA